jgi:glutathione S-transferase
LSYREWFDLNNAQRVHYNFLEMAPSIFMCLLLAGLYYPLQTALIGLIMAVSRLFYGIGYMTYGPKGSTIGAFGNDICLLALFYLTGMTGWKIANGKSP